MLSAGMLSGWAAGPGMGWAAGTGISSNSSIVGRCGACIGACSEVWSANVELNAATMAIAKYNFMQK